jgi:hypothetical protein
MATITSRSAERSHKELFLNEKVSADEKNAFQMKIATGRMINTSNKGYPLECAFSGIKKRIR